MRRSISASSASCAPKVAGRRPKSASPNCTRRFARAARPCRPTRRAAEGPRRLRSRAARHQQARSWLRLACCRSEEYARMQRRGAVARARHRAGRHSQGGSGAEHLHLLDRVRAAHDGRRAAVLHRQQGAELLLGVDLRLSHRRGRRESDQPAGIHAVERLHDRRVLPGARHEDRRLRAQPVVLLLERHGSGVRGHRPRGAAHLGARHARSVQAPARAARC